MTNLVVQQPAAIARLISLMMVAVACVASGLSVSVALSSEQDRGETLRKYLSQYTSTIKETLSKPGATERGLLFSTASFPATGRLIRRSEGSIVGDCSGVMVTKKHFLTAAHCLCQRKTPGTPFYLIYKSCIDDGAPDFFENFVYLHSAGLFRAKSSPTISEKYKHYPPGFTVPAGAVLSDLAILELEADIDVEPIPPITQETVTRYISVGFGMVAVAKANADALDIPAGPFKPGLGTVAFTHLRSCPPGYTDILCGLYNGHGYAPEDYSTSVCPGDSGGALIGITANNTAVVVGITSQRQTQGDRDSCDAVFNSLSIFTRVSQHASWISEHVGMAEKNRTQIAAPNCQEGLVRASSEDRTTLTLKLEKSDRFVSVAASPTIQANFSHLSVSAKRTTADCKKILDMDSQVQCSVNEEGGLQISFQGNGLIQIAVCPAGK
ncbi:UNVERIFIED_ORG: hypothetical protein J2W74_002039 [Methylorubrum zatmanii]